MNKYGAKKIKDPATGYVFDSKKEFIRWCELRLLERAGKISELKRQVKYVLIPSQRDEKGKVIEREVSYVADFQYIDHSLGDVVVEDVKGYKTEVYRLKKKLLLWTLGIKLKET